VARGAAAERRGAHVVAGQALAFGARAPFSAAALVDGAVGVVVAPAGRLLAALRLTIVDGKIAAIDVVTDPMRLARLDLAVLDP
jgi:RNA polymerase sigma-70 factor (ECF subfamily)